MAHPHPAPAAFPPGARPPPPTTSPPTPGVSGTPPPHPLHHLLLPGNPFPGAGGKGPVSARPRWGHPPPGAAVNPSSSGLFCPFFFVGAARQTWTRSAARRRRLNPGRCPPPAPLGKNRGGVRRGGPGLPGPPGKAPRPASGNGCRLLQPASQPPRPLSTARVRVHPRGALPLGTSAPHPPGPKTPDVLTFLLLSFSFPNSGGPFRRKGNFLKLLVPVVLAITCVENT